MPYLQSMALELLQRAALHRVEFCQTPTTIGLTLRLVGSADATPAGSAAYSHRDSDTSGGLGWEREGGHSVDLKLVVRELLRGDSAGSVLTYDDSLQSDSMGLAVGVTVEQALALVKQLVAKFGGGARRVVKRISLALSRFEPTSAAASGNKDIRDSLYARKPSGRSAEPHSNGGGEKESRTGNDVTEAPKAREPQLVESAPAEAAPGPKRPREDASVESPLTPERALEPSPAGASAERYEWHVHMKLRGPHTLQPERSWCAHMLEAAFDGGTALDVSGGETILLEARTRTAVEIGLARLTASLDAAERSDVGVGVARSRELAGLAAGSAAESSAHGGQCWWQSDEEEAEALRSRSCSWLLPLLSWDELLQLRDEATLTCGQLVDRAGAERRAGGVLTGRFGPRLAPLLARACTGSVAALIDTRAERAPSLGKRRCCHECGTPGRARDDILYAGGVSSRDEHAEWPPRPGSPPPAGQQAACRQRQQQMETAASATADLTTIDAFELPSHSQVDWDVVRAMPDAIRQAYECCPAGAAGDRSAPAADVGAQPGRACAAADLPRVESQHTAGAPAAGIVECLSDFEMPPPSQVSAEVLAALPPEFQLHYDRKREEQRAAMLRADAGEQGRSDLDGSASDRWRCTECTYLHEGHESLFLMCKICETTRPHQPQPLPSVQQAGSPSRAPRIMGMGPPLPRTPRGARGLSRGRAGTARGAARAPSSRDDALARPPAALSPGNRLADGSALSPVLLPRRQRARPEADSSADAAAWRPEGAASGARETGSEAGDGFRHLEPWPEVRPHLARWLQQEEAPDPTPLLQYADALVRSERLDELAHVCRFVGEVAEQRSQSDALLREFRDGVSAMVAGRFRGLQFAPLSALDAALTSVSKCARRTHEA